MFQNLLKKLATEFEKSNIPYMVIGGQAVLLYGEPRFTKDIDITLGVSVEKLDSIIKIASSLELKILPDNPRKFVEELMVLPVIDGTSGIRIDLIFSFSPYEQEAIKRANKINISGTSVNFASIEDLIIHKVIAGRERDIEDISNIILKNSNFDKNYISRWLREFDLSLNESFTEKFTSMTKKHC
ncbi:MAG: nucleotidyltransferase [Candidatus Melainabacteria bacterium]|nr:nucleotidyltransferase [Candidatus Melainabacteria bacterium]